MAHDLHLVERLRKLERISKNPDIYESGDWAIPEPRGHLYVGGNLYLHESQESPSYYGGKIIGFRMQPAGHENAGRMVLQFAALPSAKDVRTTKEGWGNEQKSVPPISEA